MRGNGPFLDWTNRARAVPIEQEISRRGIQLKRNGFELIGPCPRCGGTDRFAINIKKQVFNCRGCSVGGDVIQLVEHLDGVDFNAACATLAGPQPKANGKGHPGQVEIVVAEFQYHDQDGNTVLVVERREFQKFDGSGFVLKDGKRDKTFRQKRPDPNNRGKFIYNSDGVPALPYRLPQVLEAIAADHPVLIVEGEAKADLLWGWNVAATCCVGGAKKWKPEHSEFLRGADVFLLPDNDDAGWEHANKVGASLSSIAKSIRVVRLPELLAKGDVIDWAKAGGTREQLDALLADAPVWQLPKAEDLPDKKSAATTKEDELLNALAKMPKGVQFGRERKRLAKELRVNPSDIDAEIEARRVEDETAALLHGHWRVDLWPGPVDGDALIRDIIRKLQRHVFMSFEAALATALWIMLAWVHDTVATHSPILDVTSAEPESGKTTLLSVVSFLAPRAISSVDISRGALYRSIQRWQPSFVIDEFDDVLVAKGDSDKAELRSVINSGHTRGQGVLRCITDEHRPELFSTFCPKAIGMIGRKLPATTLGRCIVIELRRRKKDEPIVKFSHEDDSELADLRSRLRRWQIDNEDALRGRAPEMPDAFENRRADNWRVQLAIADRCSGAEDWGDKARLAAIKIESASDTTTIRTHLLIAIKRIFDDDGVDCMLSAVLVERLKADPEQAWIGWNKGKGLTQNGLAKLLGGRICSQTVHPSRDVHGRGYKRSQFEDEWSRYLPFDAGPSETLPLAPEGGF